MPIRKKGDSMPKPRDKREKIIRDLRIWSALLGVAFLSADLIFRFAAPQLFTVFHTLYGLLGLPSEPFPDHAFFTSLAHGNMWVLITLCILTYRQPVGYRILWLIMAASKGGSTVNGLYYYFFDKPYVSYLIVGISDGWMIILALVLWRMANQAAALPPAAPTAPGDSTVV